MKIIGNKKALHTPEFHKKKQREQLIRRSLITLVVLVVVVVPILILRNSHLLIKDIQIHGAVVTKEDELKAIISKDLMSNYLWVIPRSSVLFYPKSKIQKELMTAEPRLSLVVESLIDTNTLNVNVNERIPEALYCTDVTKVSSPNGCYFLDSSGFIFSVAPAFSSGVYLIYSSDPNIETPLGSKYLDPKKFGDLDTFVKSLSDIGLYPQVIQITMDEYHLILSNEAVIKFKVDQNLDQVYSNLSSFVEDASFKKDKNSLNKILYIDLRFGNKIFYKYR